MMTIDTIERIGTEENHDGWFRINGHVDIRFVENADGDLVLDARYDPKVLTEEEVYELAKMVLDNAVTKAKEVYDQSAQ